MNLSEETPFSQKTEVRLLFGILLLFVIINSINIRYPGIQYDEVLFANAALGGIDNSFNAYSIGGFPVLLMPYIGALKAYIYMPVFYVFGVSPASIRLPMILLTALSLYILFKAALTAFNRNVAWITLILLALDQSIAAHTRMDVGPNAIEFFLKSLCLLFAFKFFTSKNHKLNVCLFVLFALGVFNKLNFAWFVISISIASLAVFADLIKAKIRNREFTTVAKYFFLYLSAFIPFLIYFTALKRKFNLPEVFSAEVIASALNKKIPRMIDVIQGDGFYNYALGAIENPLGSIYLFFIVIILLAGSYIALFYKDSDTYYTRKNIFLWLIILTTVLFILITPLAKKTWHVFTLQPVLTILIALCVYNTGRFLKNRYKVNEKTFAAIVLFLCAAYHIVLLSYYQRAYYCRQSIPFWSEAIYDLIDHTREDKGRYFSTDWGIHNQLIAFNQDNERFNEIYGFFLYRKTEKQYNLFFKNCLKETDDEHYFILRAEGTEYNPHAKKRLFHTAAAFGITLKEHKRFVDHSDGQDIFVMYSVE